ncbi:hypothetical protein cypCar_00016828 [Cyprinus carpio]|nr:hypothetical protein cypCar_00016828 [Cyprinus carpio]
MTWTRLPDNRTTKTAPHLDGVHVVFGLVISGFEVIKKIEGLKTDSASRPYADVRVIDCGQLITKSANDVLQGKRRKAFHSEDDSQSSSESSSQYSFSNGESEKNYASRKRKSNSKSKHSKRKRRETKKDRETVKTAGHESHAEGEMAEEDDGEAEQNVKREKPVVRLEEIPPVPENRFLLRRDMPTQEEIVKTAVQDTVVAPNDTKPTVTKSGRKIKGRGTMGCCFLFPLQRYHTPPRSKSRSESEGERGSSETPPHWKEEMQRSKAYQPPSVEKWSKGERFALTPFENENMSDNPYSAIHAQNDSLVQRNTLKGTNPNQRKGPLVDNSNASGWESEEENSSKTNTALEHNQLPISDEGLTEMKKRQILSRCWESESDSEMPDKKVVSDAKHVSEKEEGEASSESEYEYPLWTSNKSNQGAEMSNELKGNEELSADTKTSKHKNKKAKRKHKHKRRNSSKSGSRRSKAKKSKKNQKPKETFHWQPPLEFGDEGEEDESVTQAKQFHIANPEAVNDGAKRRIKAGKIKHQVSENKDEDQGNVESSQDMFSVESSKGATVEVEAGVDTAEDTLVLEVAPTEVPVALQTVEVILEVATEVATDQGLTLTIVILAVAAVVAGEEGIGEVRALTAGPGHIALTVAVPPGGEVVAEAADTVELH